MPNLKESMKKSIVEEGKEKRFRSKLEKFSYLLPLVVLWIFHQNTLHYMVEIASKGIQSTWGNFQAEGIVARPTVELKTRSGHRIITKIKTKDFR